ncbi:hypothetical protein [Bdellovibrio bacteriovorus]|uniref:Uncharacterized protein n=1 Tax=Bdellovibrio bacteriovorus TaxID=959 RepID=A0A150WUY4_BDEBC|nr:hypothetical protein [Bdellovibrio bacteriovorus]KYG70102.1 hypothetical protein AZI85_15570 [Bdellovibrio bacteriovorus]
MRVITLDKNAKVESTVDSYLGSMEELSPMVHKSYHELADTPVIEKDSLAQLHANIETLTDLQARLSFLMREVRYLMKV